MTDLFRKDNRKYINGTDLFKLKDSNTYDPDDIFCIEMKKIIEETDGIYMLFNVYKFDDDGECYKVDVYKHYMKNLSRIKNGC
jgi:hypothetical protein